MTTGGVAGREAAQRRVDQIAAFRAELDALRREEGPVPDRAVVEAIRRHQDGVVQQLAQEYEVDRSTAGKQMALGIRVATLLGAVALTAAVVAFVDRFWGGLSDIGRVVLLATAPLASVAVMVTAGQLERTRYVASIFACVACAAFVTQTVVLAQMLGLRSSPHAIGLWALFAVAIAVPWRFAVPFAFGIGSLVVYLPAAGLWAAGYAYEDALTHPELLMLSVPVVFLMVPRMPQELRVTARIVLLALVLMPLLVLSATAQPSLVPLGDETVRIGYQILSVVAAALAIVTGLRRGIREAVLMGSTFAAVFMLTRFVDWWWDWMPKYLFFLILSAIALSSLWALRIIRRRAEASR